jgi:hypothetical protein
MFRGDGLVDFDAQPGPVGDEPVSALSPDGTVHDLGSSTNSGRLGASAAMYCKATLVEAQRP